MAQSVAKKENGVFEMNSAGEIVLSEINAAGEQAVLSKINTAEKQIILSEMNTAEKQIILSKMNTAEKQIILSEMNTAEKQIVLSEDVQLETDTQITKILSGQDHEPLPCSIECSIEKALDILGGKWTFLIIRDLQCGTRRFGELRKSLAGVSPKTLSERLKELERKGVVTRTAYPTIPPTVEYALTEKGRSLHPIIKAMKLWGAKWG